MLRRHLFRAGILHKDQLHLSSMAEAADLHRAHAVEYVTLFENGELDRDAMRRIGLPWSKDLVRRSRATVGGAITAARSALDNGISGQLAGGTHHAHREFGSGFCVYNDQAVAAFTAIEAGWVDRVAIIDLDVHQGDGSAAICAAHPSVFVFSMHGEKNFPFRKSTSDLDVALPDGTDDESYLNALSEHLPAVFEFRPELILYQAGVDPLAEDRLGRLSLTHKGLMTRDEVVFRESRRHGIPVAIAMGGGYCNPIDATVVAYANTYRVAKDMYGF